MGRIIGIDLGTTTSAAAVMDGSEPVIIPNDRGNRVTPSVVAFSDSGEVLVGETAKNQALINADRTIISVKRHMGSKRLFPIGEKGYSPEELSSYILKKLKKDAEDFLGEEVTDAVITVPAYFNEVQRRATIEAGRAAGLRVRRIINEPTAAAVMYAYKASGQKNILVYDLGGGTFDVTYLKKEENSFIVRATRGDNHLGGVDFDNLLLDLVIDSFEKESGFDLRGNSMLLQQLREQVERAKIELSSRETAFIALPFITSDQKPLHLSFSITRDEFNSLIESHIQRTVHLVQGALEDAGAEVSDIDALIFSGGSSRIPLVQTMIREVLKIKGEHFINPDEAVALGAAVKSHLLESHGNEVILKDVTPFALGVEIEGGQFISIIERNTIIPVSKSRLFTTVADYQRSVEIHVLQGDSSLAAENVSLGNFLLSGLNASAKGSPRIEVTFSIDEDGIVHVGASDKETGKEEKISLAADIADNNSETQDDDEYKLKSRVNSLLRRLDNLCNSGSNLLDRDLRWEIGEAKRKTMSALGSSDLQQLWESQIVLEALVGEVNAIIEEAEVEYEGV